MDALITFIQTVAEYHENSTDVRQSKVCCTEIIMKSCTYTPQTKKLKSAAENNPLHLTSEAANISSVGTNDPPSNCSLDFIQRVYA